MRFLAIFAAFVAVATAYNVVQTTSQVVSVWTLNDLSAALANPAFDPAVKPFLAEALDNLMAAIYAGSTQTSIAVVLPPMDVSAWTLQELDQALMDPSVDPALKPYLEHALNQYMEALFTGQQIEIITVSTPVGLISSSAAPEPSPAMVATPVAAESAPASSPLVQLIINVNAQQNVDVPLPVDDAVLPSPAIVPDNTVDLPETVAVPAPAIVSPQPVQVAEPIVEVPQPAQVGTPVLPSPNPIDIIAVAAPEVNPVDLLNPMPVVPGAVAGVVGPIV